MRVQDLLSAAAVRRASQRMLDEARSGQLLHWTLHEDALPDIARLVAGVTRESYPDLNVPFHARWRHFVVDGLDRWRKLREPWHHIDPLERARRAIDLVVMSVLVDAGTGGAWQFHDAETGRRFTSSEGLALASLELYRKGTMESGNGTLDAEWLAALDEERFRSVFQVAPDNPLKGVEGRVALLRALGKICLSNSDFAKSGNARPGGLADIVAARSANKSIAAATLLEVVLTCLGSIWPSRLEIDGIGLGDAWHYKRWSADLVPAAVVPFHKLSQWLTYSLVEPISEAGIAVTNVNGLTGLAEYRNGGLFVDCGALVLRNRADALKAHAPDSALIIQWRAMTVALLDALHPLVANELDRTVDQFQLARVLEGGTWKAGRVIAKRRREDGGPPIAIESDGTVF